MPKFAANLSMLFTELPFLDRFEAAARAGFKAVDDGQTEAAQALGMRRMKTLCRIIIPQAMRMIIPPTGNQLIGMLKTFEAKFWGVAVMGGGVVILAFLPWLDKSPVKSIRYRPGWHKVIYGIFVINFVILGWLGIEPPSPVYERISQVGTLLYLGFFFLMPFWSQLGTFKQVPDRVTFKPH